MDSVAEECVARDREVPRLIYITGCDGTGKTTQAGLLCHYLRSRDIPVKHVWLRFPFLLSLPLLLYARCRGFSRHEGKANARYGYWDFSRSRWLRHFLPWTYLCDGAIAALFKVYIPLWRGQTVVCERFALDMLVDLALAFDDSALFSSRVGDYFFKLIPRDGKVCALHLDIETICARRPSLHHDRNLGRRLALFTDMTEQFAIREFSNRGSIRALHGSIVGYLTEQGPSFPAHRGIG